MCRYISSEQFSAIFISYIIIERYQIIHKLTDFLIGVLLHFP